MEKIIQKLIKLNGKSVKIVTAHKWFGVNEYQCNLSLINDDMRLGFRIANKEIYILKGELESFKEIGNSYMFNDTLMKIAIIY